jgi:hypothetical protein
MTDAPAAPGAPTGPPLVEPMTAEPVTGGDTLVEERPAPSTGDGDHERFAHYVRKEKIVESAVTGRPVVALCGKKWIPGRDPNRFPVCPDCKRIYEGLPDRGGSGDSGGDAGAGS